MSKTENVVELTLTETGYNMTLKMVTTCNKEPKKMQHHEKLHNMARRWLWLQTD